MRWTVETLNETVDAEIEALPADMRARLARVAGLIEEIGLERVGEPHRNFAGAVRDGRRAARGHRASVRKENGEDAAAGDRFGAVSREIGSMMEVR